MIHIGEPLHQIPDVAGVDDEGDGAAARGVLVAGAQEGGQLGLLLRDLGGELGDLRLV